MKDYKLGRIYAIKSNKTDKIYIGSTFTSLKTRLTKHRHQKTTASELLSFDDVYIELIEYVSCENKQELLEREKEIIKNTKCINYQYNRPYNDRTIKIKCDCGVEIQKKGIARHKKTELHLKNIENYSLN
jgi:predicted GIY-YIG superfamily endonuclease